MGEKIVADRLRSPLNWRKEGGKSERRGKVEGVVMGRSETSYMDQISTMAMMLPAP